jgi:5-hydroxyisourate hydrolase
VSEERPTISTHVLDSNLGEPAQGIAVRLERLVGATQTLVSEGGTDIDGRIASLVPGALEAGIYRLTFDLTGRSPFFRSVALEVSVEDVSRSYHVPLLLAPFAITSYRGS